MKLQMAALAVAITAALSACGGGGSTAAAPAPSTQAPSTGPADSTTSGSSIVTSVNPATYGAGTDKQAAFDYLNAQRQACGFGLLQQEPKLDIAAQAHADYQITNNVTGHYEDATTYPTGFTGVGYHDRYQYAGYFELNGTEVISGIPAMFGATLGQANVMSLMTLPYHGTDMLRSYRDAGIGIQHTTGRDVFQMNFGATSARPNQLLAGNAVATYPCAGLAGVMTKTYADELPAPVSGRNLQMQPIGQPIYVRVRDGQILNLTAYHLRLHGSATDLALILRNQANDTTALLTGAEAFLMPDAPLQTNTVYDVDLAGTNNGQPFAVTFSFTTGAY